VDPLAFIRAHPECPIVHVRQMPQRDNDGVASLSLSRSIDRGSVAIIRKLNCLAGILERDGERWRGSHD